MTAIEQLFRNGEHTSPNERLTTNEEVYRKLRKMIASC